MKKIYILMIAVLIGSIAKGQWQNVGGPIGCDVHCFAVNGNNIFAGTRYGIYLSTNNGQNWTAVNNGLTTDNSIASIVVKNNIVFAATWHGVFVSTNNGASWVEKDNGIYDYYAITSLAINGNNIYGGTYSGEIWVSSDDGNNWSLLNDNFPDIYSLFINGTNFYAGTAGGVYKSTDNGNTWNLMNNGIASGSLINSFAVNGNSIYACYGTMSISGGVYLSTNNGASWTAINTGLPQNSPIYSLIYFNNTLYAASNMTGIFKSINNGQSWTAVNNGIFNTKVKALALNGNDIIAGSNGSGIYITHDLGTNWIMSNSGIQTTLNTSAFAESSNNIYCGLALNGLGFTNNNGNTWNFLNNGLPNNTIVYSIAVKDSTIFAGHHSGEIYVSHNNGASWTNSGNGLPANSYNFSIAISDTLVYASLYGAGVFKNTINGQNWTAINNGLTELYILTMVVKGSTIFVGTNNGVFKSTNGGANWQAMNNGLISNYINSLALKDTSVYVSASGKIYYSGLNGNNWTLISNNLPYISNEKLLYCSDDNLFVYSDSAYIYMTNNNGNSWSLIDMGLPLDANIGAMITNNSYVFAGTTVSGAWRRPLSEIVHPYTPTQIIGNPHVCKGQSNVIYTVPVIPGALTYIWNLPSGFSGSSNTNTILVNIANNANSGIISVKGQNTLGTGDSSILAITVFDTPLSPSLINGLDTVAVTQSNIIFNIAPISNATSYSWTLPNGFSGTSNTNSINISIDTSAQSGNIYIKGQNVCGFGPQVSKFVYVNSTPPPPIISQVGNTLYSSSAFGNQWYNTSKSLIFGATSQTFSPQTSGDYYVVVTVGQHTSGTSGIFHFILNSLSETDIYKMSIYPNPATNSLTINLSQLQGLQNATVIIYDIQGKQLLHENISQSQTQIDISSFAKGIYIVKLQTDKECLQSKFVKE